MNWNDTVVVITGASEGIGASCARLLDERRAKLGLIGLPSPQFQGGVSDRKVTVAGDITSADTRRKLVDDTIARFGRIDVLINNAGVGQYGWPSEVDTEVSKQMFDVNVFSALALTQLVIPGMRRRKSGVIVNIGSVGGKVSLPWAVMYCATKWALHCIDDSLRRELRKDGISVVKVCPGIVDTKFRDHVLAGKAPDRVEAIRRVVSPDQVAAGVIRGIERKQRTVYVPKLGWAFTTMEAVAPWAMDVYLRGKSQAYFAYGSAAVPGDFKAHRTVPHRIAYRGLDAALQCDRVLTGAVRQLETDTCGRVRCPGPPPCDAGATIVYTLFEWDDEKNRLNHKKHGVSFEMATLVFEDAHCFVGLDRVDETGEQRWHAIGTARLSSNTSVVLFVVHVYREEIDGEEITRIISARRADKNDIRRYQKQEMD